MDGLIIKKKWIDKILSGKKTLEIRGSKTQKTKRRDRRLLLPACAEAGGDSSYLHRVRETEQGGQRVCRTKAE